MKNAIEYEPIEAFIAFCSEIMGEGSPIMLVLTRKLDEQITIGGQEIQLKILEVQGGRVRLGIEAPKHIRIERVDAPIRELVGGGAGKGSRKS